MSDEAATLKCVNCGSDDLWAWYPEPVRQTIAVWLEDGDVVLDYTGTTDSADDSGDNDSYMCGSCDTITETVEELVGLPKPALLGRTLSEWEVLGMLFPNDEPRPDDQFPSGADFIDMVCAHFGFTSESFVKYIELRQRNEELLANMQSPPS